MKKIFIVIVALVLTMTMCACGSTSKAKAPAPEKTPAEKALDSMSLNEKIGQLFIIKPEALDFSLNYDQVNDMEYYARTKVNSKMKEALKKYPAGGIILFSKNIKTPKQVKKYTASLQSCSGTPLFIAVDEEGGIVSRIAGNPNFKVKHYESMTAIGNTGDTKNAYNVGNTIGKYLKSYGFNLDFAPDADVNTNPKNIVIGERAFGSDPKVVAKMVSAAVKGFHNQNIMTTVKHFPGHGNTTGDTHTGYVSVSKTWDQLQKCELIPFKAAIKSDTDMIMVAHITAKNVSDDGLPASISKSMVTEHLRGDLGYKGVVTTDSMAMGAIIQHYSSSTAAVKAIKAGDDIVLMPEDYRSAVNGIKKAVKDGTLSEKRIDQSVLRILELKDKYGLLKE